jgi:hypothetical protein
MTTLLSKPTGDAHLSSRRALAGSRSAMALIPSTRRMASQWSDDWHSTHIPSSHTWINSSEESSFLSDTDEFDDRSWFICEYNRLATKVSDQLASPWRQIDHSCSTASVLWELLTCGNIHLQRSFPARNLKPFTKSLDRNMCSQSIPSEAGFLVSSIPNCHTPRRLFPKHRSPTIERCDAGAVSPKSPKILSGLPALGHKVSISKR